MENIDTTITEFCESCPHVINDGKNIIVTTNCPVMNKAIFGMTMINALQKHCPFYLEMLLDSNKE